MKKLNQAIDRFCILHPNFGIPNLMLYVVIGNVVLGLLSNFSNGNFLSFFSYTLSGLLHGQVWRLITFVLIPESTSPFYLLITCYFYYWIGSTLERQWGTAKFTTYYLSGMLLTVVGASIVSLITGYSIPVYGANYGNKFADMALEKGCAYVIVDEKEYAKEGDERYILVEDCLTTFKELAREHRRHFDIPVVGITGTNGKTTTKELVSAVLGEKFNVMFTQGNFNNDVGVPKTLFRLSPENEIAVVEMGASHPGDIRKLVEYVEPTCGMITNVGRAHLQGFGSFKGVKKTKGELYDYLAANDALVFINADNEHLMQMAEQRNINRLITYGKDGNCGEKRQGSGVRERLLVRA